MCEKCTNTKDIYNFCCQPFQWQAKTVPTQQADREENIVCTEQVRKGKADSVPNEHMANVYRYCNSDRLVVSLPISLCYCGGSSPPLVTAVKQWRRAGS